MPRVARLALRAEISGLPRSALDLPVLRRMLRQAREEASTTTGTKAHSASVALTCCAMDELTVVGRHDLIEPLLGASQRIAAGPHGQRVYNAALRGIANSRSPGRTRRAMAVVEEMRAAGISRSGFTMQQVFAAADGDDELDTPVERLLLELLRSGMRPNVGSLNEMIRASIRVSAASADGAASTGQPAPDTAPSAEGDTSVSVGPEAPGAAGATTISFAALLGVVSVTRLAPNGQTILHLLRRCETAAHVSAVEELLRSSPAIRAPSRDALRVPVLCARARVDRATLLAELASGLQREGLPPPPPLVRRALTLHTMRASELRTCHSLLEVWWLNGMAVDEHTARRLLDSAGEGARRGVPGAKALLVALRDAMFGEAGAALVQRLESRRSAAAEHAAVRALARAEWRAGLLSATAAQESAVRRLSDAGLRPTPKLIGTCVYMHAASGDFYSAIDLLKSIGRSIGSSVDRRRAASESPYLSLIAAVRAPTQLVHAIEALRLMLAAGVAPSLRTRVCLLRMAARVQQTRAGLSAISVPLGTPPVPGSSRFWDQLPVPLDTALSAIGTEIVDGFEGVDVEAEMAVAADMVLSARMGALLDRMNELVDATNLSGSGVKSALAEMVRRQQEPIAQPPPPPRRRA